MISTALNNVADRESPCINAVDINIGLALCPFVLRLFPLTPLTDLQHFLVCVFSYSA